MSMAAGGTNEYKSDINITPLVDVVLVLLIIFMVVTPMLSSGVDVKLPKAKTAESEKDMGQHFVIAVKNDGTIYVDRTQATLDNVVQLVNENRGNRPLLVKGDQAATYGQVRTVLDKIHEGVEGTDTVLLAADKPKDEE
jgi:biopolymer transport protein TolR